MGASNCADNLRGRGFQVDGNRRARLHARYEAQEGPLTRLRCFSLGGCLAHSCPLLKGGTSYLDRLTVRLLVVQRAAERILDPGGSADTPTFRCGVHPG